MREQTSQFRVSYPTPFTPDKNERKIVKMQQQHMQRNRDQYRAEENQMNGRRVENEGKNIRNQATWKDAEMMSEQNEGKQQQQHIRKNMEKSSPTLPRKHEPLPDFIQISKY